MKKGTQGSPKSFTVLDAAVRRSTDLLIARAGTEVMVQVGIGERMLAQACRDLEVIRCARPDRRNKGLDALAQSLRQVIAQFRHAAGLGISSGEPSRHDLYDFATLSENIRPRVPFRRRPASDFNLP